MQVAFGPDRDRQDEQIVGDAAAVLSRPTLKQASGAAFTKTNKRHIESVIRLLANGKSPLVTSE